EPQIVDRERRPPLVELFDRRHAPDYNKRGLTAEGALGLVDPLIGGFRDGAHIVGGLSLHMLFGFEAPTQSELIRNSPHVVVLRLRRLKRNWCEPLRRFLYLRLNITLLPRSFRCFRLFFCRLLYL